MMSCGFSMKDVKRAVNVVVQVDTSDSVFYQTIKDLIDRRHSQFITTLRDEIEEEIYDQYNR